MNVLRLRGLPYKATPDDIRAFFRSEGRGSAPEFNIVDVSVDMGPDGRPNGEALAEFATEDECERALAFDRQMMGNRYVEIRRAGKGADARGSGPQHAIPVALQKPRGDRPDDRPGGVYFRREPRNDGGGDRDRDRNAGRGGDRHDSRDDNRGRRSRSRDRRDRRDRRLFTPCFLPILAHLIPLNTPSHALPAAIPASIIIPSAPPFHLR
jgi:RNA recognition motif-containing protein